MMRAAAIKVMGEYAHAYLYFDRLVLIGSSGGMITMPSAMILEHLRRVNDRGSAVESPLELSPDSLEADWIPLPRHDSEEPLAVHAYDAYFYVGTESGLYRTPFAWGDRDSMDHWSQSLGIACSDIDSAWGVLTASCGRDGLAVLPSPAKWLVGLQTLTAPEFVAPSSYGTYWLGRLVINDDGRDLEVVQTEFELVEGSHSMKHWVYRGTRGVREVDWYVPSESANDAYVGTGYWRQVAAHGTMILIRAPTGRQRLVTASRQDWTDESATSIVLRDAIQLPDAEEIEIRDFTWITDDTLIVEHDQGVAMLHSDEWATVVGEPTSRLATYPNSRRYRQIVTAIGEDSAYVLWFRHPPWPEP